MLLLYYLLFIAFAFNQIYSQQQFLRIQNQKFQLGNQQIFLSGVNYGWYNYGYDFGNDLYQNSSRFLESWLRDINRAGGNSIRVWIHTEAQSSPEFDSTGFVISTDKGNNLIRDLGRFLDVARQNNILVTLVLWNAAQLRFDNHINLIWDDNKLRTYIDRALIPMVRGLRGKEALASWEIMNEPEGGVNVAENSNPCYDTTKLQGWAGWTGKKIPMQRFQRFINWQSAAIHREDPKALVTLGSFAEIAQSDGLHNTYNYYKDECLIQAGGENQGILDYFQMHSYAYGNPAYFRDFSAFKRVASDYKLNKPLVIGEFSNDCSEKQGTNYLFAYLYNNSYDGAWSWQYNAGGPCSDSKSQQDSGMSHIRNYRHRGSVVRRRRML